MSKYDSIAFTNKEPKRNIISRFFEENKPYTIISNEDKNNFSFHGNLVETYIYFASTRSNAKVQHGERLYPFIATGYWEIDHKKSRIPIIDMVQSYDTEKPIYYNPLYNNFSFEITNEDDLFIYSEIKRVSALPKDKYSLKERKKEIYYQIEEVNGMIFRDKMEWQPYSIEYTFPHNIEGIDKEYLNHFKDIICNLGFFAYVKHGNCNILRRIVILL